MTELPAPVLPAGYRLVDLPASRLADLLEVDLWAFPSPRSVADLRGEPSPLTWDRARGIEADGVPGLVAMHASYPFADFPVPGATTAVAGLTWVGVHPGHRRRGLLRAIIADHLLRSAARGEAVSALTASEPAIYGRFGYGMASQVLVLHLQRGARLRPVPGSNALDVSFESFDPARHADLIAQLHRDAGNAGLNRPGWVTRETTELQAAFLSDPPADRGGYEARRLVITRRDGRPTGYAMFRRKLDWAEGSAAGTVLVREAAVTDPASAHALWSRLLDIDLMREVIVAQVTPGDPLLGLLVDLRAARPRISDNIWIRIVDLPAALAARRYAAPLDTVIEVADPMIAGNAGRWRVRAEAFAGGVRVEPTDSTAEVSLDIAALGSLYLGAPAAALIAAGAVTAPSPEALGRFTTAFGWPMAPGSSWIF